MQKYWFLILIIIINSCESNTEETVVDSIEVISEDTLQIEIEEYKILLNVTEIINTHKTGELKVWIGAEEFKPKSLKSYVSDESIIPENLGQYAIVTPIAPDFIVKPSISKCFRLHHTGVSEHFILTPKARGEFEVGAIVELFDGSDCTGNRYPKTSETLTVKVRVDGNHLLTSKFEQLLFVFWDKFLSFWGALITLLFAVAIFLIRRILGKKTGFDENTD